MSSDSCLKTHFLNFNFKQEYFSKVKFKKNSESGKKDNFLVIALYFLSIYYVCLWNDIPYTEALMVLYRFDQSLLDAISYSLTSSVASAAHLYIIFENFTLKDNLVFLLDIFLFVFFLCFLFLFLLFLNLFRKLATFVGLHNL